VKVTPRLGGHCRADLHLVVRGARGHTLLAVRLQVVRAVALVPVAHEMRDEGAVEILDPRETAPRDEEVELLLRDAVVLDDIRAVK